MTVGAFARHNAERIAFVYTMNSLVLLLCTDVKECCENIFTLLASVKLQCNVNFLRFI